MSAKHRNLTCASAALISMISLSACDNIGGQIKSLFGSVDFSRSEVMVRSSAVANGIDEVIVNVRLLDHESKPVVGFRPDFALINGDSLDGPGCFTSDNTGLAICTFPSFTSGQRSIRFNNLPAANLTALLTFVPCSGSPIVSTGTSYLGKTSCFVSRSSIGTFFDSSGVLKTAAINQPRSDYDPVAHNLRGILLEPASTNLIAVSLNMADQSYWTQYPTITTGSAVAPDGGSAATVISPGSGYGFYVYTAVAPSQSYVFSGFVKAVSGSPRVSVGSDNLGQNSAPDAGTALITIDVANGVITHQDPRLSNVQLVSIGNGWYRWSAALVSNDLATYISFVEYVLDPGEVAFWGAQQEVGTTVTSFIPTSGTTVTRSADSYQL